MLPKPTAILFDLDDTILTFGNRRLILLEVAEELAARLPNFDPLEIANRIEEALSEFWSCPNKYQEWRFKLLESRIHVVASVLEPLGVGKDVSHAFAHRFHELRDSQIQFFPGALETIEEFKRRGVRLALVTNGMSGPQRSKVERFGLVERFEHVQIEEEFGFGKPDERAYVHAMAALHAKPHETWMVGDNLEWEVEAPQRLGITAIWHDHLGKGLPPGSTVRPDMIVRSIQELLTAYDPI